jgi:hypothetical protein
MRAVRAALAIAFLAGCKDEAIDALETTRDKVCACDGAACVNAALDALADKPTKHQRKAEAIARQITDCVARIYQTSDAAPAVDAAPIDAAADIVAVTPP